MKNILEDTKFIMKKYNIKANKSLGQNFLINQQVVEEIVKSANINKEDLIIEIGPGLGILTQFLLEEAGKVICIELDTKMIQILNDRFSLFDNFQVINQNVKIVANLPYYITTPIIMKLLEEELDLDSITVMIQKEVADRLIAIPGSKDTGAITYSIYYYTEPKGILEVPKESFIPEPEVTSKVIKLNIRKNTIINVKNKEFMFKIIKNSFLQRRKTLLNALTNSNIFLNKEQGYQILNKLGLDENIRAEKLTLEDFAKLTNEILENN